MITGCAPRRWSKRPRSVVRTEGPTRRSTGRGGIGRGGAAVVIGRREVAPGRVVAGGARAPLGRTQTLGHRNHAPDVRRATSQVSPRSRRQDARGRWHGGPTPPRAARPSGPKRQRSAPAGSIARTRSPREHTDRASLASSGMARDAQETRSLGAVSPVSEGHAPSGRVVFAGVIRLASEKRRSASPPPNAVRSVSAHDAQGEGGAATGAPPVSAGRYRATWRDAARDPGREPGPGAARRVPPAARRPRQDRRRHRRADGVPADPRRVRGRHRHQRRRGRAGSPHRRRRAPRGHREHRAPRAGAAGPRHAARARHPGARSLDTAGAMSFVPEGRATEEVGHAFDDEGIAVRTGHSCAQPILRRFGVEAPARPSLTFHDTLDEIDRSIDWWRWRWRGGRRGSGRGERTRRGAAPQRGPCSAAARVAALWSNSRR